MTAYVIATETVNDEALFAKYRAEVPRTLEPFGARFIARGDGREIVCKVLEICGAEVLSASSAAEALPLVVRERPDVIVSDVGMPEEDGYSFLARVRALPVADGGLTPAAALTAFASTEDRMRALKAGFQIHVPKPVQPAELATVVASLSGRRR